MKVIEQYGRDDLAMVYLGQTEDGKKLEFVESLQPPFERDQKMVMIVSTLFGCPVKCIMCDAGGNYSGKVSSEDMFAQIDHVVKKRFPRGEIPVRKFKIQFSRMGEPAFNDHVLTVLDQFPSRFHAPGFLPSLSTIGPAGRRDFFEELLRIKKIHYRRSFQLQFSIHSTDPVLRDRIIPVKKMSFAEIARYAGRFHDEDGKKITLNYILAKNFDFQPRELLRYFSPDIFFIKMTPLNPTYAASSNDLEPGIVGKPIESGEGERILETVENLGYEALLSIGELEENRIGSNCGQYVESYMRAKVDNGSLSDSYDTFNYG